MIEINLLPEELKIKAKAKAKVNKPEVHIKPTKLLYLIPVILVILVCAHIYLAIMSVAKSSQYNRLNTEWKKLEPQKKILDSYNKDNALLSENAKLIQQLVSQRINWPEKLNKLSAYLPSGIWFNEITASNKELVIQASVVSLGKDEMGLIAKFIDSLKNDAGFFKGLGNLELGPVQHKTVSSYDVADFTLTANLKNK